MTASESVLLLLRVTYESLIAYSLTLIIKRECRRRGVLRMVRTPEMGSEGCWFKSSHQVTGVVQILIVCCLTTIQASAVDKSFFAKGAHRVAGSSPAMNRKILVAQLGRAHVRVLLVVALLFIAECRRTTDTSLDKRGFLLVFLKIFARLPAEARLSLLQHTTVAVVKGYF